MSYYGTISEKKHLGDVAKKIEVACRRQTCRDDNGFQYTFWSIPKEISHAVRIDTPRSFNINFDPEAQTSLFVQRLEAGDAAVPPQLRSIVLNLVREGDLPHSSCQPAITIRDRKNLLIAETWMFLGSPHRENDSAAVAVWNTGQKPDADGDLSSPDMRWSFIGGHSRKELDLIMKETEPGSLDPYPDHLSWWTI